MAWQALDRRGVADGGSLEGGEGPVARVVCHLLGQDGHGGCLSHWLTPNVSAALVREG